VLSERLRLYHLRQATAVKALLEGLVPVNSAFKDLQVSIPAYALPAGASPNAGKANNQKKDADTGKEEAETPAAPATPVATGGNNDELILTGPFTARRAARQMIAALDLPQPGVQMEMWGIQISSSQPEKMARVLEESQEDIAVARAGVQGALKQMQSLAASLAPEPEFERTFAGLGYVTALEPTRTFSLTDILLRLAAAKDVTKDGEANSAAVFANGLTDWLNADFPQFAKPLAASTNERRRPFQAFFTSRGLRYDSTAKKWVPASPGSVAGTAYAGRAAVLRFAHHYGTMVHNPSDFSPYYLQQTADALNDRLQLAVHALNSDIYELFLAPTLEKIRRRAARTSGVEYAQVGRTSVATLSGTRTVVSGKAISPFDETQPMRLSELLKSASALETEVAKFIPKVPVAPAKPKKDKPATTGGTPPPATPGTPAPMPAMPMEAEMKEEAPAAPTLVDPLVGGFFPYSKLIGLIGAFGEDRTMWRELHSGVSLDITPFVLRNAASADLNVNLTIGDPLVTSAEKSAEGTKSDQKIPPLARITEHSVQSRIVINSLDLFDLSTFSSQATRGGGRGYVPIVGTIWRGIFGDVPVLGNLFSWRKPPRSVYHQSILLVNSVITPTAMSVAVLLPTDISADSTAEFLGDEKVKNLGAEINGLRERLEEGNPSAADAEMLRAQLTGKYREYNGRTARLLGQKVDAYVATLNRTSPK
jgi:hypothetical protein